MAGAAASAVFMDMEYILIRSRRKTISISVGRDSVVTVRAPLRLSRRRIDRTVDKHTRWIASRQARQAGRARRRVELSRQQIEKMKKRARLVMGEKTARFAQIMGTDFRKVKITSAKTRWGSCGPDNGICYSYRVMLLSDEQRDYIAVHELAHTIHKNHSRSFYREIEKILPDYRRIQDSIKRFENLDLY